MVAFRAKFISLGQFGQMMFGAGRFCLAGFHRLSLPPVIHPIVALAGGALAGSLWGLLPAILKTYFNANEVLVTLILNPIAVILVGLIRSGAVAESAAVNPPSARDTLHYGFYHCIGSRIIHLLLSLAIQ